MILPQTLRLTRADDERVEASLTLAVDDDCFAGHFERLPVLAGVTQVHWIMALAERHWQRRFVFKALHSTKFQQLIRPPVALHISVQYLPERGFLKFSVSGPRGVCSKGILRVEASA